MRFTFFALIIAFILLALTGCATKYEDALNINKLKAEYLEATRTGEILNALQTKVVATATYLNKIEPQKYNNKETFVVGIYYPSVQNSATNQGLDSKYIDLFMEENGQKIEYEIKEELNQDHSLLSQMPLYSKWYKYYLIEFEKIESEEFAIVIKEASFGETKLEFNKQ
ncbi:MAG: hypothetical protein ACOC08_04875 [Campylobacterales bacterium]